MVGLTWRGGVSDYLMYITGLTLWPILGLTLGLTGRTLMTFLYLDNYYMRYQKRNLGERFLDSDEIKI